MGARTEIQTRPLMDHGVKVLERAGGAAALGDLLRRLRRRRGISQEAIARHVGMNHNVYGYLERGLSPRPGMLTVTRLARGHSVSIELLIRAYLGTEWVDLPDAMPLPAGPLPMPPASGGERPDVMGACLAAMRERTTLSQLRLAKAAEMQRSQVGSVETGGRPNVAITTIARLVRGLAPDADLVVVVGLLAQVFAGEVEREAFGKSVEIFLGLASSPQHPPRGLPAHTSGEARRGWSAQ